MEKITVLLTMLSLCGLVSASESRHSAGRSLESEYNRIQDENGRQYMIDADNSEKQEKMALAMRLANGAASCLGENIEPKSMAFSEKKVTGHNRSGTYLAWEVIGFFRTTSGWICRVYGSARCVKSGSPDLEYWITDVPQPNSAYCKDGNSQRRVGS